MSFLRYANPRNMWLGNMALGAARGAWNLYRSHAASRLYGGGMRAQTGTAQSITHTRQARAGVSNKRIRRIIDQEINKEKVPKYIDTDVNMSGITSVLASNTDILALNLTRQGTGAFERIGNRISLDWLRLKLILMFECINSDIAGVYDLSNRPTRVTVIWDKEGDGSTIPTWDFIFGTTDNEGVNSTYFGAGVRPEQNTRFVVLKDETFCPPPVVPTTLGAANTNNTTTQKVVIDWFLDFKKRNMVTYYNHTQTTPQPSDITSGTLLLAIRTDPAIPSGGTNLSAVYTDGNASLCRLKFHDK